MIITMLATTVAIVVSLVAWSLHLMQQAVDRREFSLMLAGTLVAFSAAAMVAVYFLVGDYIGFLAQAHGAVVPAVSDPFARLLDRPTDAIELTDWPRTPPTWSSRLP